MNITAYRTRLDQAVSAAGLDIPEYFLQAFCDELTASDEEQIRDPAVDAEIAADLWDLLSSKTASSTCVEARRTDMQTQLYVALPDMPFITDSVLMDLTQQDIAITFLLNLTMTVHRDAAGQPCQADRAAQQTEDTIVYVELDPLPDADRQELVKRVDDALRDVDAAVSDYEPMQNVVRDCIAALESSDADDARQTREYLAWLLDDHFTFLGHREFDYSGGAIQQVAGATLGIMRNRAPASRRVIDELPPAVRTFLREPALLVFSKSGTRSHVHRPAYPDYIGVKRIDRQGNVVGERGFYGLFTSPVYTEHPHNIPYLRDKTQAVLDRAGLDPRGYDGKSLAQILNTFPRDELFQTEVEQLHDTAMSIAHIHERRITRLFVREVRYGLFWTCLVYVPRELYNTKLRVALEDLFRDRFQALDIEFDAYFSESILVRLQFSLRVDPEAALSIDVDALQDEVIELAQDWQHSLKRALRAANEWNTLAPLFHHLPRDFDETMTPTEAHAALHTLNDLTTADPVRVQLLERDDGLQLRLLCRDLPLSLSTVMPMLEHFGFEVLRERSLGFGDDLHAIYQYGVAHPAIASVADYDAQPLVVALTGIVKGAIPDDHFNQIIVSAGLSWREVAVLRAYAAYMKQAELAFDALFLSATLNKHPHVTRALMEYFLSRFDPRVQQDQRPDVTALLDSIERLNEDKAYRKLFELIDATVRTNYFQRIDDAGPPNLAFKLLPKLVEGLPAPLPAIETFVFGPAVEGVHLRSSPVARGGIRWSDRSEDYRTEVLDLMKTQVVKNALIVPSGAKGGFLVKDLSLGREAGLACYRMFIDCLLDITDNIVDGKIIAPAEVRRHDGDDPYLVVAADKGTATFSDEANALAQQRGYWLADAFASGGATGYDHKQMGITARGAWVSVTHHLRGRGMDAQADPVTAIGIGDMSGDVFGNGMLSSPTIRLVAAFNHRHIFLDPAPDPTTSFAERKRLFEAVLGWDSYDQALISAGGGVFERTLKQIPISAEVAALLGLDESAASPDELIRAILCADVTLLWNGGVGTYVKASWERNADVGDRANDSVRVDASALRCSVIGEGGNLGLTQAARVEFAQRGGAVNADFIDNSAGVDCSDHEVNLKILLNTEVAAERLTLTERDAVLRKYEDDVAQLVLSNNDQQAAALTLAQADALAQPDAYGRLIDHLEAAGALDRALHALPDRDTLHERTDAGGGLTLPELAVLMCCTKISLKAALAEHPVADQAVMTDLIAREFPAAISTKYRTQLIDHPLANEIAATLLTNLMVDQLGMAFSHRLLDQTSAETHEIAHAYLVVDAILNVSAAIEQLKSASLAPEDRTRHISAQVNAVVQATAWLLHQYGGDIQIDGLIQRFRPAVAAVEALSPQSYLSETQQHQAAAEQAELGALGITTAPACTRAPTLCVARLVESQGVSAEAAAAAWRDVDSQLGIGVLLDHLQLVPTIGHWEEIELDAARQQLLEIHHELAVERLREPAGVWQQEGFKAAWSRILDGYLDGETQSLAFAALTVRKLTNIYRRS